MIKHKRAIELALLALGRERQRYAPESNMFKAYGATEGGYIEKASEKYAEIEEAIKYIQSLPEPLW